LIGFSNQDYIQDGKLGFGYMYCSYLEWNLLWYYWQSQSFIEKSLKIEDCFLKDCVAQMKRKTSTEKETHCFS